MTSPPSYATREAVGLVLAFMREDDELVDAILSRYSLTGESLQLLLGVLVLIGYGHEDADALAQRLYDLACIQAVGR